MGKILRIIGPTILGVALGVVVSRLLLSGYFSQWYLVTPPERISRFVIIRSGNLWAQAENGTLYQCSGIQCRRENAAPETSQNYEIIRQCNSDWPMFSPSTHPPSSFVDCRESLTFFVREAYALDKDRNLWYWRDTGINGEMWLVGWCSLPFGAIVGLAIGLVWSRRVTGKVQNRSNAARQLITADLLPRRKKKVRRVVRR